jgi:hypothetical protein
MRSSGRTIITLVATALVGCGLLYDYPNLVGRSADAGDDVTGRPAEGQDAGATDAVSDANVRPSCDAAGLVGYWNLDEGSGTVAHDCSSNKLDGLLLGDGGPTWVLGVLGNALSFDGDGQQLVMIGSPTRLELYGGVTLTAWINLPNTLRTQSIFGRNDGWWLSVYQGSAVFTVPGGETVSSTPIPPNTWTHIAGVLRPGFEIAVYVGASVQSVRIPPEAGSGVPEFLGGPVGIGFAHDYTYGRIDEVRIYNHALTSDEIAQLATR